MLNFLVLSDTHGREDLIRRVLSAHAGVDAVFFLGDGLNELEALSVSGETPPLCGVRGNCDSATSYWGLCREEEICLPFGKHRLLLLHGHTVGVKGGIGGLVAAARRHDATAVLYGHTHTPTERYLSEEEGGPLYLFNPGSLASSTDGAHRYGMLALEEDGGILFSCGKESL